jgi:hypothetical protein
VEIQHSQSPEWNHNPTISSYRMFLKYMVNLFGCVLRTKTMTKYMKTWVLDDLPFSYYDPFHLWRRIKNKVQNHPQQSVSLQTANSNVRNYFYKRKLKKKGQIVYLCFHTVCYASHEGISHALKMPCMVQINLHQSSALCCSATSLTAVAHTVLLRWPRNCAAVFSFQMGHSSKTKHLTTHVYRYSLQFIAQNAPISGAVYLNNSKVR